MDKNAYSRKVLFFFVKCAAQTKITEKKQTMEKKNVTRNTVEVFNLCESYVDEIFI